MRIIKTYFYILLTEVSGSTHSYSVTAVNYMRYVLNALNRLKNRYCCSLVDVPKWTQFCTCQETWSCFRFSVEMQCDSQTELLQDSK